MARYLPREKWRRRKGWPHSTIPPSIMHSFSMNHIPLVLPMNSFCWSLLDWVYRLTTISSVRFFSVTKIESDSKWCSQSMSPKQTKFSSAMYWVKIFKTKGDRCSREMLASLLLAKSVPNNSESNISLKCTGYSVFSRRLCDLNIVFLLVLKWHQHWVRKRFVNILWIQRLWRSILFLSLNDFPLQQLLIWKVKHRSKLQSKKYLVNNSFALS